MRSSSFFKMFLVTALFLNGCNIPDKNISPQNSQTQTLQTQTMMTQNTIEQNPTIERLNAFDKKIVAQGWLPLEQHETVDSYYLLDNKVFFEEVMYTPVGYRIVKNADAKTFEVNLKCSRYGKDKTHVYFEDMVVEGADPLTFRPLTNPLIDRDFYGMDSNHVFYENKIIKGASPKSFQIIVEQYSKDAKFAYYQDQKIEGADPTTLTVPGANQYPNTNYSKDKNNVYFGSKKIVGADSASAQYLDPSYLKDKANVYYNGMKVSGVDLETFKVLEKGGPEGYIFDDYARDKNAVYYQGTKLSKVNPKTFEPYGSQASITKTPSRQYDSRNFIDDNHNYEQKENNIYYTRSSSSTSKKIKSADISTFKVINEVFAKDKNHVYLLGEELQGADPKTFEIVEGDASYYYAKDRKRVYYYDDRFNLFPAEDFPGGYYFILPDAAPGTFTVIDNIYSKDKSHVYRYDQKINDADPDSFEPLSKSLGDEDDLIENVFAKDKNHLYFFEKVIE